MNQNMDMAASMQSFFGSVTTNKRDTSYDEYYQILFIFVNEFHWTVNDFEKTDCYTIYKLLKLLTERKKEEAKQYKK